MNFKEAIEKAGSLGHHMIPDPPHELSKASRYSCDKCWRAVLSYRGNVYGSALTAECKVKEGRSW